MAPAEKGLIIATTLNVLATIFVSLRMISRTQILKKSSIDDYLIGLAVIFSWAQTASIYVQAQYGAGRHIQQVPYQNYSKLLFTLWIGLPLYNIALALTKVSALYQLLRFFTLPGTRAIAFVLIGVVATFGLAVSIASIFTCHPISAFWHFPWTNKCFNAVVFWYINACFNIATDIAVVALPIYVLRDLRLVSRWQRFGVNAIFLVGIIACVTSVLRLHSIYNFRASLDFTYYISQIETWCAVEVNTAIICACMQSLKPLLGKINSSCFRRNRTSNIQGSDTELTNSSSILRLKWSVVSGPTLTRSQDSTEESFMAGTDINGALHSDPSTLPKLMSQRTREVQVSNDAGPSMSA